MAFGDSRVVDELERANGRREGVTLDASEVADLLVVLDESGCCCGECL